jgi:hypothetical protein
MMVASGTRRGPLEDRLVLRSEADISSDDDGERAVRTILLRGG